MVMTPFKVLAEPKRERILKLLATKPLSVNEIAEFLNMGQPQTSKHLKVLLDANFVWYEVKAQNRIYHLDHQGFDEVDKWLRSIKNFMVT